MPLGRVWLSNYQTKRKRKRKIALFDKGALRETWLEKTRAENGN